MHDLTARELPHPRSALRGRSGHVLLVEDNPVSQLVATVMLENLGFCVDVVNDGADAVRAATLTPYHAILMDCDLPILDGYQATSKIRNLQGASRHTPIIAVTAATGPSDEKRCLAAGMDDYLPKPLHLGALTDVLARWAPDGAAPLHIVEPADLELAKLIDQGTARPALDAQVLDRLSSLGEDADFLGQLARLFLVTAETCVETMRRALGDDDAAAVARSAHTLTGASGNVGAPDLARLCVTLETDGKAGDLVSCGALLEAVERELGRVRSAFSSLGSTP